MNYLCSLIRPRRSYALSGATELFLMWSCLVNMRKKPVGKFVTKLLPKKARKKRSRGRPFEPGNPWRFPDGVSGNPGGRKRLIDAHTASLATVDTLTGKTVAELISEKMCTYILTLPLNEMDRSASIVRELRQGTEGDTVHTPDSLQVVIDR